MLVEGNSQILYGGMKRISENSMIVIKNRSHSVTAQLVVPEGGAEGVIIAQGGAFGGWSLYLKEGRPTYCYNLLGVAALQGRRRVRRWPAGERQVRMEFAYDGGGLGKGGDVTLYVDGAERRRGPRRGDDAADLLRRRDDRPRHRHRDARQRRLRLGGLRASPARSSGCRSTSTRPPRIPTT